MSETKVYTLKQVEEENSPSKPLLVINNAVYDVTTFLNEHPGGEEVLLEQSGKDASELFEDVGHSTDAREMMTKYKIGDVAESDRKKEEPKETLKLETTDAETSSSWTAWIIPAALAIAATVIYKFFFTK
ncbi:hypothetical protein V9T40_000934 [Parthenolecanium corni]|uniref:Cytochrome b5 n=1 Tax=Parthenolecanium corni TaxID=536013 RepID=A0AAN9TAP1_9HEMI